MFLQFLSDKKKVGMEKKQIKVCWVQFAVEGFCYTEEIKNFK